jgi:hypothetical protein
MLRAQFNLNGSKMKTAFLKLSACWGIVFGRKNEALLSETRQILQP